MTMSYIVLLGGGVPDQRLPRPHAGERDGLRRNVDPALTQGDAGEVRRVEVAGLRIVAAEMRAARIDARDRRRDDGAAHQDQVLEIEPVVPGQIESEVRAVDADAIELRFQRAKPFARTRETARIADDAGVLPHQLVQRLAY